MVGRKSKKAYVVAVDMGYGHQRAALPLLDIAQGGEIITANEYAGIPQSDKTIWQESRRFYEIVSRFKGFPVLGDFVFSVFDKFQEIQSFYPTHERIDSPSFSLRQMYNLFVKRDWGKHFIQKLNQESLSAGGQAIPFVTTFFTPAFMADFWKYKGPIYLVVTDTDISRTWAPLYPQKSKIVYCASTERVADRLERYGVHEKNIALCGFPLPREFTKNRAAKAKKDLIRRLAVLDPNRRYVEQYKKTVQRYVGRVPERKKGKYQVHVTFAIGGAGAQGEVAENIMQSVKPLLADGTIQLHFIAGIHAGLATRLRQAGKEFGLSFALDKSLHIHVAPTKQKYFLQFNRIISETDILWTKPSELVFYAGLGIPLLLSNPIGSQEKFNRTWLVDTGAGIDQRDPCYTHQWLPDLLEDGTFAEAAMQGFIEIPRNGAENIKKLVLAR